MIGRGNHDRVDLLVHDIEHAAVVVECARPSTLSRSLLGRGGKPGIINIHYRHQPFTESRLQARLTTPTATDHRDGKL
jgi:hypothetical protein